MNSKSFISEQWILKFLQPFATDNLGGIDLGGNQEKKAIDLYYQFNGIR